MPNAGQFNYCSFSPFTAIPDTDTAIAELAEDQGCGFSPSLTSPQAGDQRGCVPCLSRIPGGALPPEPGPQASWVWVVRPREPRYPGAQEAGRLLMAPGTGSSRQVADV